MNPDYEETTRAFRLLTLPKAGWTHHAHLAAGLWFVLEYGLEEARTLVPAAIRRFNAAVGTADTATSGYHETLTQFYLTRIGEFAGRHSALGTRHSADSGQARAEYRRLAGELCLLLDDRRIPLRYYSEARLWSAEARATWLEPDLISEQPVPRLGPEPGSQQPGPSTGG